MIPRPNRFANVSLAPPETLQANFGAPQMQFQPIATPQMEEPGAGGQMGGIAGALMPHQTDAVGKGDMEMGAEGKAMPTRPRFAGSLDTLKSALKGIF